MFRMSCKSPHETKMAACVDRMTMHQYSASLKVGLAPSEMCTFAQEIRLMSVRILLGMFESAWDFRLMELMANEKGTLTYAV